MAVKTVCSLNISGLVTAVFTDDTVMQRQRTLSV